ncbi:MAG: hypothetical protein ACFFKA_00200 [Candidatus Thorarchaeota archaeon]
MIISIFILGTLLGADAYIHIVKLQETKIKVGFPITVPSVRGQAIKLRTPKALFPT